METTELMAKLVLQIGIILFAVRIFGRLAKLIKIPSVLGELTAGIVIGPYALGSIGFPGFKEGLFPLEMLADGSVSSIAVSTELYAFATIASIILLFFSGLETDIGLFLKYSIAGSVIGLGGAIISFAAGAGCGFFLLPHILGIDPSLPVCLFLGIISTATSVGITARILSDQKKMDSPEGVTILAAAVFDDVLGIIILAIVMGIVALIGGSGGETGSFNVSAILGIAGKALGIWLGFTALGLIFSKKIASFLKLFKHSYDFSILALGIAFLLAGFFEGQGLAMIIGAYIAGLSLSKTDIAAVIQNRVKGLYEFFVPLFFAVMGMMVNVREILSAEVLIFGGIFILAAILSKIIGCGGPAMLLGFNGKGALRIGTGMVPRGEVALILAGIGLASGILDNKLFSAAILITLVTTVAAPPLLSFSLKLKGQGTKKTEKDEDSASSSWDFETFDILRLVVNRLLINLRAEGFYVQVITRDTLTIARKEDISFTIKEEGSSLIIDTSKSDMPFAKNIVYETVLNIFEFMHKLKNYAHPEAMKKELIESEGNAGLKGKADTGLLSIIETKNIIMELKADTKEGIIIELVDKMQVNGLLQDRDLVLSDVMEREEVISTGMAHGLAVPHAKSDGVVKPVVAIGIKKDGIDFGSIDGEPSRLFIMEVSPKSEGVHVQFLAAIGARLRNEEMCSKLINAKNEEEVVNLLRT